jgi:hypothetical protein
MSTLSYRRVLALKHHTVWFNYYTVACWVLVGFYGVTSLYHLLKLDVLGTINFLYYAAGTWVYVGLSKNMGKTAKLCKVVTKENYQEVSYIAMTTLSRFIKIFLLSSLISLYLFSVIEQMVKTLPSDWQYGNPVPVQSSSSSSKTWLCDVDCETYQD